jgi:ATP-binding protein involved in chromosome partitioning
LKAVGVGSTKGGVGKTLIALNVARELANRGHRVSLLDADLDNSCFAQFTGANAYLSVTDRDMFKPYKWGSIDVFSMSLIAGRTQSVSMEASRYAQILDDVINRTEWDPEYMVVDLPGGSSDVFRTVIEILGESYIGDVVVCQPLMRDATEKFLHLHEYLEIPVIGLLENMSWLQIGKKEYYPFGRSTVEEIASKYNVPVLGKIPLSIELAEKIEKNDPIFPEDLMPPIRETCTRIEGARVQKPGFISRLVSTVDQAIKGQVEKLLVNFILIVNKVYDINAMRTRAGVRDEKPTLLLITDETGTKELTRIAFKLTPEALKVLKNPSELDYGIQTDFRTLARIIMGKRKLSSGKVVDYNAWDAWLHGDIKTFGIGHAPKTVKVLRTLFEDPEVAEPLRSRMGAVLEAWI